jgi:hypothetical protein
MALTQPTPEQVLHNRVGTLQTRIRLLLAQQALCIGLTVAAVAGLLFVAATRFRWWTDAVDYLWALFLVGGAAGLLYGWSRRISPLVAAQIADERAGLKERLSTAVELSRTQSRSEIATAQIADAAGHAGTMNAAQVLPWRVPTQIRWLVAACAVLAAAIFLPDLPIFHSPQDRLDRAVMQTQGAQLQRVAKELEKEAKKRSKEDENGEILRRVSREMKQLGKDQEKGRISKKQAMLKLNDLQKQVKEAQNGQNGGKSQKPMNQVANQLQDAAQKNERGGNQEGARQLKQMADNLEKKDFDAAKRQLEELAKKMQSGQMNADDAKKAADTLEQMAKAMEGSNLDKASQEMKEAAKQLAKAAEQAKQFQKQMASAKTDAERQQLQQQMSQQMSQGMQQAAQTTKKAGGT